MRYLIKFVLVDDHGGTWFDMGSEAAMLELAARIRGTHVERWTYRVLPDGTHGTPFKERQ